MWAELFVAFVFGVTIAFFIVKWLDKRKLKKLEGGYNKDDDPGREIEISREIGYRGSKKDSPRKPELQNAIEYAKRELLQSKDSGRDDNIEPVNSDTELNHRY